MSSTRVRFAPSPTGPLHIGGVRTALFNYLFAQHQQGTFILRIEDTDQKRWVEGAEEYIEKSLQWLGLTPDEGPTQGGNFGPYKQSERMEIYTQYIPKIIESGYAYYAFDTPEELELKRKEYEKEAKVFSYNARTRKTMHNSIGMSEEEILQAKEKNPHFVIRFKMPENEIITTQDLIRGNSSIQSNELDDKVLVKADGMPTYHFANVIDDHLMKITHVIRGEEWLPSLALHLMMYQAFGWTPPQFAHLPLILKPEGNGKLSKRDGAQLGFPVFPMEWKEENTTYLGFKELGYFPQAVLNFLANLGWTPQPENHIFTLPELSTQFDIEKVHKAGARFDIKKAEHLNKEILHSLSVDEILPIYTQILQQWNIPISHINTPQVVEAMKDRVSFLNELVSESLFFYEAPKAFNSVQFQKATQENTEQMLTLFLATLTPQHFQSTEALSEHIHAFAEKKSMGLGKVMMPLRLSMVGAMKGPDVPVIMRILGKEETQKRIQYFIEYIPTQA